MTAKPEEEKAAQTPSLAVSSMHHHILFAERHQHVTLISVTLHSAWGLRGVGSTQLQPLCPATNCLAVQGTTLSRPAASRLQASWTAGGQASVSSWCCDPVLSSLNLQTEGRGAARLHICSGSRGGTKFLALQLYARITEHSL